ncbi:MAG: ADP-ribosylation factor-like protein [Myxococcota bacterium]
MGPFPISRRQSPTTSMVQLNLSQREIILKLVYYGPALSGKTTNLQVIYQMLDPKSRGRLMTLDTADDRTLFFDLLPIFFKTNAGFKVKLKLYTVPGQVMHNSTRRIVLAGADGVVFVADSQLREAKANNDAWKGMVENLKQNGLDVEDIPIVIQFNKRDLPDIRSDEEIEKIRQTGREPVFKAVAVEGKGVLETLYAVLKASFQALNTKHDFERKFGLQERDFLRAIFKNVDLKTRGINLGEDLA